MASKISPFQYLRAHQRSLYNARTDRPGFDDWFWFLVLPLGLGIALPLLDVAIPPEAVKVIVGALAIFVGLIFGSLVSMINLDRNLKSKTNPTESDKLLLRTINQLTANILFCIFIAFLGIVLMLLIFVKGLHPVLVMTLNGLVVFILAEFCITFLMILKRIYIVFTTS